jgi:GxxExxY protein
MHESLPDDVNELAHREVKAVAAIEPIPVAQVLSYLKTTRLRLGLLMTFHGRLPAHGIRRVAI